MTPDQQARSEAARVLGLASAKKATEKRLAKWAALGIDPTVAERIYMSGYQCAYQQMRRKERGE